MRRTGAVLVAVSLLTPLGAQPPERDPILQAMTTELQRARRLTLLGLLPYYFEFAVDDAQTFAVSATLGAAFAPQRALLRPLRVRARVGDSSFDNTNSIFSDFYNGTRYDSDNLPQSQDPKVLRHSLWLAADRAFKTAIDALGRKRAALRGVNLSDPQPDFSAAPALTLIRPLKTYTIDEKTWRDRVRTLSEVYLNYPGITGSAVDFEASAGNTYFVNTEGTTTRTPDSIFMVRTRAGRQAPDGSYIYDGLVIQAFDPAQLPPEPELRARIEQVARNVEALAAAPTGELYTGPVLFEGPAAAQVFGEVFGLQLGPVRRPVSEPNRPIPMQATDLENRLGSRVLPEWMNVVDDPTRREWNGQPLLGFYEVDLEGVAPRRVSVVEQGVLKSLLGTRTPAPGVKETTGHARLPGGLGMRLARPSNLFLEASQTVPDGEIRARFLAALKERNKPYGIIIRKMDFPSAGSAEELRRANRQSARGGGGRLVSMPVLAYKVYTDGREELVRGLRFRGLNARAFRDILAAGDRPHRFDFLENGAPMAMMGGGNYVVGCSIVAPSLLFDELELYPQEEDRPRLPVVPPPTAAAGE